MSEVCRLCGLPVAPAAILGQFVHVPIGSKEVIRALNCPSYGNATPEEDIPAIWRSTGHWQAVWDRSR